MTCKNCLFRKAWIMDIERLERQLTDAAGDYPVGADEWGDVQDLLEEIEEQQRLYDEHQAANPCTCSTED